MARKNQKLINYHTGSKTAMPSGSSVDFGEIVVRHNAETPELLIKIGTDSFGVFQASGAVKTAIDSAVSAAQSTLNTTISGLQSDVKSLSSATKTLIDEVSAATKDTYATKADLEATSGSIITAYEKAVGDAKIEIYNSATTFATKAKDDAIAAAAASAITLSGLIDGVDDRVDTVSGNLNTFKTDVANTYATKTGVTEDIKAAKSEVYTSATTAAAASAETLNNSIEAVDGRVDTVSGDLNTFKTDVADTYATKTGVTSDIKDAKDSVYLSATTAAAADAKTKADTAYSSATTAAAASAETLNNSIEAVDGKVGTLSGNVHTRIEGLKTDLTNTINEKVAVAYRYKGTKTNYVDLPTSEMSEDTIGFVYNVENANGNYPAGTNYAWNGTEWDALGGSVDLSPYALKTEVSASADTLNKSIEAVDDRVDTVSASLETFKTTVADTYETKNNVTTAITAAKDSVYLSATTAAATDATTKANKAKEDAIAAAAASADTLNTSIKAVKTTADNAVQTASIIDSDSKVSVSKVDTELKFDFSNLVIDCGEFN